jgi:hypothetical protein
VRATVLLLNMAVGTALGVFVAVFNGQASGEVTNVALGGLTFAVAGVGWAIKEGNRR